MSDSPFDGHEITNAHLMVELKGHGRILTKVDRAIHGDDADGSDGLLARVAKLETHAESDQWWKRTAIGAMIGAAVCGAWAWLGGK